MVGKSNKKGQAAAAHPEAPRSKRAKSAAAPASEPDSARLSEEKEEEEIPEDDGATQLAGATEDRDATRAAGESDVEEAAVNAIEAVFASAKACPLAAPRRFGRTSALSPLGTVLLRRRLPQQRLRRLLTRTRRQRTACALRKPRLRKQRRRWRLTSTAAMLG